jgi:hypothetical protein
MVCLKICGVLRERKGGISKNFIKHVKIHLKIIASHIWKIRKLKESYVVPSSHMVGAYVCGFSIDGMWFRIPPGAWMSVSCGCCVLAGQ